MMFGAKGKPREEVGGGRDEEGKDFDQATALGAPGRPGIGPRRPDGLAGESGTACQVLGKSGAKVVMAVWHWTTTLWMPRWPVLLSMVPSSQVSPQSRQEASGMK